MESLVELIILGLVLLLGGGATLTLWRKRDRTEPQDRQEERDRIREQTDHAIEQTRSDLKGLSDQELIDLLIRRAKERRK